MNRPVNKTSRFRRLYLCRKRIRWLKRTRAAGQQLGGMGGGRKTEDDDDCCSSIYERSCCCVLEGLSLVRSTEDDQPNILVRGKNADCSLQQCSQVFKRATIECCKRNSYVCFKSSWTAGFSPPSQARCGANVSWYLHYIPATTKEGLRAATRNIHTFPFHPALFFPRTIRDTLLDFAGDVATLVVTAVTTSSSIGTTLRASIDHANIFSG